MLAWLRWMLKRRRVVADFRFACEPLFNLHFDETLYSLAPEGLPTGAPIKRGLSVKAEASTGVINWRAEVVTGKHSLNMGGRLCRFLDDTSGGYDLDDNLIAAIKREAKRTAETLVALVRIYGQASP